MTRTATALRVRAATMRAAVVTAPRAARVEEHAAPEPGPDDVLVRVEGCGVCGSNVPVWEGRPWFSYPLPAGAPGHEGWGAGETGALAGTRVAFLSQHAFAAYDVAREDELAALPPALDGLPF